MYVSTSKIRLIHFLMKLLMKLSDNGSLMKEKEESRRQEKESRRGEMREKPIYITLNKV